MLNRIKRALCWMIRHVPEDYPSEYIGYQFRLHKYTCRRCGNVFWQFGTTGLIQIHDDDPRLVGLK